MANKRRRSIFRQDAGRAFLRFLIGTVLLIALVALFYIFVLQAKIDIPLPGAQTPAPTETVKSEPTPQSTAEPTAVPVATAAAEPVSEPTAVPTIEPTAQPTDAPPPEPTATPIPQESMAGEMLPLMDGMPETVSESLKLGLKELNMFESAGRSVLVVRGYAYIEGADAAQSHGYLVITDAASGVTLGMYPVTVSSEDADLTFDAASGSNLEQAFFRANVDVSGMYDGIYLITMAVENNGRIEWNNFDDRMFHFYVMQGLGLLSE